MLNEAEGKAIKLAKDVASLGSQLQDTQVGLLSHHPDGPGGGAGVGGALPFLAVGVRDSHVSLS